MKGQRIWRLLGFLISPLAIWGFVEAKRHLPWFENAFLLGVCLGIIALLPFVFRQAKKEAVPAKKSDFIGYAVILVFLLVVVGIGYAVIR